MKNLITGLVLCVLSGATFATTWTVDDNGNANFDNIQAAVDAASDGDDIIVMPGIYTGNGDSVVDMLGKEIWLHSSDGFAVTIIDGETERRVVACISGETPKTVIEGFTIKNGGLQSEGGGIWCRYDSSPKIVNCIIMSNSALYGGGICCRNNSSPLIMNCTVFFNTGNNGGGIWIEDGSNPSIENCTVSNNAGGGIWAWAAGAPSAPVLSSTSVCDNGNYQIHADSGGNFINGGGNCIAVSCDDSDGDDIPDECQLYGACCVNGACIGVVNPEWCNAVSGNYLGDFTTCEDKKYPCCEGNVNSDNAVNVIDLLTVIDAWGSTNSPADANEDGIVDVSDLLIVVGNWGPCE